MDEKQEWMDIKTVVRIESYREDKSTGDFSENYKYYISSLPMDAERINKSVRSLGYRK